MHSSVPEGAGANPPTTGPEPARLTAGIRTEAGVVVVSPSGELDHDSATLLKERLAEAVGRADDRVVVDCRGLSFCDSTGLNVLLVTRLQAEAARVSLVLADVQPRFARVLELTGTDAVFDIRPDVDSAVAG
ncbi:STAS domain-containing protein [Kitasatospora sp. NPDC056138]|uniref:STAS domain-containing protein n=1 Tax=Kitasatospora sp. NPDC056138 TaxID=3345724 RepID=UPI0035DBC795